MAYNPFIVAIHPAVLGTGGVPPYSDIQTAVNMAASWGLPAVVQVYPGTYVGDVVLKPGITLAGYFAGDELAPGLADNRPIIKGKVSLPPNISGTFAMEGVDVEGQGVGVALDVPHDAATDAYLMVRNCELTCAPGGAHAVAMRGGGGAKFRGCALTAPAPAVATGAVVELYAPNATFFFEDTTIDNGEGVREALHVADGQVDGLGCKLTGKVVNDSSMPARFVGGRHRGVCPLITSNFGAFMTWWDVALEPNWVEGEFVTGGQAMMDLAGSIVSPPPGPGTPTVPIAGPGVTLTTSRVVLTPA